MIPKEITRNHILKSIKEFNEYGCNKKYDSTKYDLLFNGRRYPPKYIISIAYKFESNSPHPVKNFNGGKETNNFLENLGFSIIDKNGNISKASVQTENINETYFEGKEKCKIHKTYERDTRLAIKKKETILKKQGRLKCEICGFDFHKRYGERGYGYIECHHNLAVSKMKKSTKVKLDDLSLLCSNCHRIIHRIEPWISVNDLKELIKPL